MENQREQNMENERDAALTWRAIIPGSQLNVLHGVVIWVCGNF